LPKKKTRFDFAFNKDRIKALSARGGAPQIEGKTQKQKEEISAVEKPAEIEQPEFKEEVITGAAEEQKEEAIPLHAPILNKEEIVNELKTAILKELKQEIRNLFPQAPGEQGEKKAPKELGPKEKEEAEKKGHDEGFEEGLQRIKVPCSICGKESIFRVTEDMQDLLVNYMDFYCKECYTSNKKKV
jgi:flagellar biosynthesis/type III secretory pathway protein FliH